jgi:hypothetical protein
MQVRSYRRWLAAAALAIAPVLAPRMALAQFQSNLNSGHALDSNGQVGSGGINGAVNNAPAVSGNDIVFNNVTGGRGFHGKVDNFGSGAFQGTLAGVRTDQFVAGSSGAPTAYSPGYDTYTPRQFFGSSRGVAPPPGTLLLGSSGAAIGTALTPANPYASVANANQLAQIRPGNTNIIGAGIDQSSGFLSVPDARLDSSLPNGLNGSLLTGITTTGGGLQLTPDALNAAINNPMPGAPSPNSLDPNSLASIRAQISSAGSSNTSSASQNLDEQSQTGPNNVTPVNPYQGGNPLLPQPGGNGSGINTEIKNAPLQMPANSPLNSSRLNDSVQTTPLGTFSESPNGVQLVSPGAYSQQYGEMTRQLQQYATKQNQPEKGRQNATRPKVGPVTPTTQPGGQTPPGSPGATPEAVPGTTPGAIPAPGSVPAPGSAPIPQRTPGAGKNSGVKIDSIAGTVTSPRAKKLHDLLATGDDALKADRFKDAIGVYESAARVAPNNQMITLGLANADLAGGYYAAAETNIRRAFTSDATVLMSRQDLSSMISSTRLDFVRGDLKDLAEKNPKLSRPWFLLAYIAYNTGHDQAAADDLKQAEKLSGSIDSAIHLMQSHWRLPEASDQKSSPNLNK